MKDTRVALVQGRWCGDRETTRDLYQQLIEAAVRERPHIVCLPEFTLSPYFPQTTDPAGFSWAEPLTGGPSGEFFGQLARTHGITVIGSLYEQTASGYVNTAVTYGPDGVLLHAANKIHIPSSVGYHESTFFSGGDEYTSCSVNGMSVATPTCYDQWFPEVARIHSLNGAEYLHYPTAIGSELTDPGFDSCGPWQTVMRGHAIANGLYISAANRVGNEGNLKFYGSSFVCDPTGRVIATASRDDECFVVADLLVNVLARWRSLFPLREHRRPETYGRLTSVERGRRTNP